MRTQEMARSLSHDERIRDFGAGLRYRYRRRGSRRSAPLSAVHAFPFCQHGSGDEAQPLQGQRCTPKLLDRHSQNGAIAKISVRYRSDRIPQLNLSRTFDAIQRIPSGLIWSISP
jgi:hypothetical protein